MTIVEPDFTMKLSAVGSSKFDLTFNKRVKKRDTGQYVIEPGDTLYGLTLSSALKRIACHRVAKKYEEDNITLRQFMRDYKLAWEEVEKLCKDG